MFYVEQRVIRDNKGGGGVVGIKGVGKTREEEIYWLVEKIKPLLAHREPVVQSGALAELLSMWLAGFHIIGDVEATGRLRAELLANHSELVRELTVVNAEKLWMEE